MRLLETVFLVAVVAAFFLWRENLISRVGGGAIFMLLGGIGEVCWRIRDRNQTFWKYVECLSLLLFVVSLLSSLVHSWRDSLLVSMVLCLILVLNDSLITTFGLDYFPEVKKLIPQERLHLTSYNLYRSGAFFLNFRTIVYSVVPLVAFGILAREEPQIVRLYSILAAVSLLLGALIYWRFACGSKASEEIPDSSTEVPQFFLPLFGFLSLFGFLCEWCFRKSWFFYIATVLFFHASLFALPAYVQRSRPVFAGKEIPPEEWASRLIKRTSIEILIAIPYAIVVAFALGLLAELTT